MVKEMTTSGELIEKQSQPLREVEEAFASAARDYKIVWPYVDRKFILALVI